MRRAASRRGQHPEAVRGDEAFQALPALALTPRFEVRTARRVAPPASLVKSSFAATRCRGVLELMTAIAASWRQCSFRSTISAQRRGMRLQLGSFKPGLYGVRHPRLPRAGANEIAGGQLDRGYEDQIP